jgi:DNA-binding NarL/FixJ family response regulator
MTETPTTRVLVADDHAVVRTGLRHILEATAGITVVAEAGDAESALRLAREHRPDVVVLDVSMPGPSGISVIPAIRRDVPDARVLVLSMYDDPEYVDESRRAGAHGYVLKDTATVELRAAVAAVLAGDRYFFTPPAPRAAAPERTLHDATSADASEAPLPLTTREQQVLVRVAAGATSKQIAAALGVSPRTVETHRESIARKLGISSVAGLTRYVIEHRLSE